MERSYIDGMAAEKAKNAQRGEASVAAKAGMPLSALLRHTSPGMVDFRWLDRLAAKLSHRGEQRRHARRHR